MKPTRGPALSDLADAPKARRRGVEGFTLIEIMISVAVLAILVVGVYSVLGASQSLYATGITRQEIQDRVRRALNAIALELRQASAGSPVPAGRPIVFLTAGTAGDQNVNFRMCIGFDGTNPTFGPEILYTTVDGDGDADNGIDDNRNRMVDERRLMRFQVGSTPRLIADNVREGSVRFTPTMSAVGGLVDRIQVSLTLQGVDSRGLVIEASDSVTVDLRNQ